MWGVTTSRH
uniref:Uncharacterized protein n=1 Tax=Anguilla anguilla TaxID=7936 RepID=A0A0E9ULF6_ANGAN